MQALGGAEPLLTPFELARDVELAYRLAIYMTDLVQLIANSPTLALAYLRNPNGGIDDAGRVVIDASHVASKRESRMETLCSSAHMSSIHSVGSIVRARLALRNTFARSRLVGGIHTDPNESIGTWYVQRPGEM